MISGPAVESPGSLARQSRASAEGDSGAAAGGAELIHRRTFLSESHELSAEQPGHTPAAHDTRACQTQKALLGYGAAAPRASQPAG